MLSPIILQKSRLVSTAVARGLARKTAGLINIDARLGCLLTQRRCLHQGFGLPGHFIPLNLDFPLSLSANSQDVDSVSISIILYPELGANCSLRSAVNSVFALQVILESHSTFHHT